MNVKQRYLAISGLYFIMAQSIATPETSTGYTFPAYNLDVITHSLNHPWAMAEIAPQTFLITTKPGQLLRLEKGQIVAQVTGVPDVYYASQGGLLDIVLHPDFHTNHLIYLSFAQGTASHNHISVMQAELSGNHLQHQKVIFSASPDKDTPVHYGGRLLFLEDKTLILTVGEGFNYREQAQVKSSQMGKLLRMKDDGSVPDDNPFTDDSAVDPYIWSIGHRNPQGLAYDPRHHVLYEHEHGPAGGDEVNLIEKGKNYGWPVITKGMDYSGAMISPYQQYPGMEQPIVDWTPSIAPSSMQIYYGDMFKQINGDLLVTTLKTRALRWLKVQKNKVMQQRNLLRHLNQRMRYVHIAADGSIYLLTDGSDAKLLRMSAKTTAPAQVPKKSVAKDKLQPGSA
ncbi:PQQ-dependent sugar dehydrogenase [Neptunicella marina]|uniref:PQQ-dependent sugar dehydrogenase n=1 Tax=Neptunicella marina TaxID=2125989 RepID=A0A8J6M2N2_9ALTE|nr:PQQ-dependent sugar dehydrogenase [Neptunicella marina]MBC3764586.1 PQQ-dependent sugar dehydrogenase [Neptunicella marina]